MTREEHLRWAKDRALQYVQRGSLREAYASFLSDLNKHDGTRPAEPVRFGASGLQHLMRHDIDGMRQWIEGAE